jgi:capsule polysaccharide export protein KpsE/RkpR
MLSFLSVILRKKKTVMLAALAGFALSIVISLVLPSKYVSMAAFIPGGVEQELAGTRSFLSRLGAFSESYATFVRVSRNYIVDYIVRSHMMADMMDARFDLRNMYGKDTVAEAREELARRTFMNVRDEGVLEIAVEAPDPVLARDMTAAYIEFTDSLLLGLTIENAESKIKYLESELASGMLARDAADSVMAEFMKTEGVYEIQGQARAAFQIMGALTARMSALEVERSMLETTRQTDSPDLRRLDLEIEKIRAEITRITVTGDQALFPPVSEMPGLTARYLGMMAERMAQEFTLAFLRLKLEDARISSNSTVGVIRVIDPPVIPERRSWPKRKQIVIILTMASVLWACFIILVREKMSMDKEASEEAGR